MVGVRPEIVMLIKDNDVYTIVPVRDCTEWRRDGADWASRSRRDAAQEISRRINPEQQIASEIW